MRRDLADFWNLLWELALGAAALFLMLDALAPPEHLFWKPLDLDRPIGQATAGQVRGFDIPRTAPAPEIQRTTEECMATLRAAGVQVQRAEDTDDGGFCVVQGAVRITGGAVTPLRPGGVVMQCPLAIRYVIWDRQVLQPLAQSRYGVAPAAVDNMGTYSCRRIYGSQSDGDRPSEHARANALDVAGVTLADGRRISVLADWNGDGPAGRDGQAFIRSARDGACRLFGAVLSPDYNEAHRDHLHLDGAPYSLCR